MKSFNERNPVTIAVVGLVVTVVVVLGAFYWQKLPFINTGTDYHADFHESAGLKSGDDVLVAGVQVGTVDDVRLEGTHVRVDFQVDNTWVGDQSMVSIKIKTLLGQKFLSVDPLGTAAQDPGQAIPLDRTSAPFDVTTALEGLGRNLTQINTAQLARSFTTLADAFRGTPQVVRASLQGLSRLSQTIASRDNALALLVKNASQITQVLSDDSPQIGKLLTDGNLLLQELQRRSAAITALLQGTESLSRQLSGLVDDNTATLHPALAQLERVTTILEQNQSNLDNALRLIGPYYNLLNNAVGNGPWLDVYLCGLFTLRGVPDLNATSTRNCAPQAPTGNGG